MFGWSPTFTFFCDKLVTHVLDRQGKFFCYKALTSLDLGTMYCIPKSSTQTILQATILHTASLIMACCFVYLLSYLLIYEHLQSLLLRKLHIRANIMPEASTNHVLAVVYVKTR